MPRMCSNHRRAKILRVVLRCAADAHCAKCIVFQHALRLIAFNQLYKILSVDKDALHRPSGMPAAPRKRPADEANAPAAAGASAGDAAATGNGVFDSFVKLATHPTSFCVCRCEEGCNVR
jgi:hypothetical protein